MSKCPVSVLVVLHCRAQAFLMLRRVDPQGFWQSVTGSLEPAESPLEAAIREVAEETGLQLVPEQLRCHGLTNRYAIPERWRHRYAHGVTHNVEHVFSVDLPDQPTVAPAPAEHAAAEWVSPRQALDRAWSWTNRDAIRLVLHPHAQPAQG